MNDARGEQGDAGIRGELDIAPATGLLEAVSGQVVWSGTEAGPSSSFNVVLEDGRAIEGSYEGGYERIDPIAAP